MREKYNLNISLKPVGCVGVCNQTPLMEIVTSGDDHFRYTNVTRHQVEEILLKHIKPGTRRKRLKHGIFDLVDTFISEDKLSSQVNVPTEVREKYLNNFLSHQVHLATVNSGILTPDSYDEYCMLGGFQALKKCLNTLDTNEIINDYLQ